MHYFNLTSLKRCGLDAIIAAHPNTSFPDVFTDEDLADFGFAIIEPSAPPNCNSLTQGVTEIDPIKISGRWVQQWRVFDLPQEEIDRNLTFKKNRELSAQKLSGIEFEGVMCSATGSDQAGVAWIELELSACSEDSTFESTVFQFENGNHLLLTSINVRAFLTTWRTFRRSFFIP